MSKLNNSKKIMLSEEDIPKQWYNIQADLPHPLEPAFNTKTGKIATKEEQEKSQQKKIYAKFSRKQLLNRK